MAFPYVTGHPDYSSTGPSKFIPQIWSGKMATKFYEYTVLSQITNTKYEGEIKKQGDTVIIRTVPDITIVDHAIGQAITYERPVSEAIVMSIDKGKRWAIELDNIVKVQSDLSLLNTFVDDAVMQMKIAIERSFFNDPAIHSGMDPQNAGGQAGADGSYNLGTPNAPVALTSANVLDSIVDCGTVLDEQNIPEVGRWMVIPPWMAGMIKKSDLKDASLTGDAVSPLRNGRLGMIDRFTLYVSNLLKKTSTYTIILFGISDAISFASQIVKTDHIPTPSDSFSERVRGLQVYGYKVIVPKAYGALIATKGST